MDALRLQIDVQRRLYEQLEVINHLFIISFNYMIITIKLITSYFDSCACLESKEVAAEDRRTSPAASHYDSMPVEYEIIILIMN